MDGDRCEVNGPDGCDIGLIGGLAVSTFSKTLAFLFGLFVFGVQVRNSSLRHSCEPRADGVPLMSEVRGDERL